jgi:hypothetical protein
MRLLTDGNAVGGTDGRGDGRNEKGFSEDTTEGAAVIITGASVGEFVGKTVAVVGLYVKDSEGSGVGGMVDWILGLHVGHAVFSAVGK